MYKELLLHFPSEEEKFFHGWDVRALTAKACEHFPVAPAFFCREENGKTIQTQGMPPPIVFGDGKGLIRIAGLGRQGAEILAHNAPMVATALSNQMQIPYRFKMNTGECTVARSYSHLYKISRLCLAKRRGKGSRDNLPDARLGQTTLEFVEPMLKRLLIDSLCQQAAYLDQDDNGQREAQIGTDEMLNLRIHEGVVRTGSLGKNYQISTVSNLVFSIDLELSGIWVVGRLRSLGCGRIRKVVL